MRTLRMPKDIIKSYKKMKEEINARPIKKVVQAQARKKRRMVKKLDRARKKAENISDNLDMTDKERTREIRSIYKRAGLTSKKKADVKYVVAKRGSNSQTRPKGPYRVVDKRLKKDKRKMKKNLSRKK
jgi:AdoMet-dependent rRNA methyltransferase SPB1